MLQKTQILVGGVVILFVVGDVDVKERNCNQVRIANLVQLRRAE